MQSTLQYKTGSHPCVMCVLLNQAQPWGACGGVALFYHTRLYRGSSILSPISERQVLVVRMALRRHLLGPRVRLPHSSITAYFYTTNKHSAEIYGKTRKASP